ncbi:hypothetical protein RB195_012127 [Necator americanus]|uniref:Transmembrane protein 242 n=1 Tax=Necator americanus TaxID=51031 RepID=A0ABR1D5M1_NECAM
MNAILFISLLFVVDVLSYSTTRTPEHFEIGVVGNETFLDSEEVKKSVGMKKHKYGPLFMLTAFGAGLAASLAHYIFGNETFLDSEEAKKSVGMKKHKIGPIFIASAFGVGLGAGFLRTIFG